MDREIELRHLRYFVAVAEELHFGRAALRLHLAQPPLSQQIRKLEEIVGHALFVRTSRAVRLTSAGEVFLERARRTLRNVHEDIEEARSVGRGEVGSLRVGMVGSGMLTSLPAVLGRYRRMYPQVNLRLEEMYTSGIVQGLNRGTLDVGFLRDGGAVDGLELEILFSEPFVAVVPVGHALAHRTSITAAALRDEPFVFYAPTVGMLAYEKPVSLCLAHGFRPKVVQEAPNWLTMLRLVGAGLGVTIAPACVREISAKDVVCLRLGGSSVRSKSKGGGGVVSDIELAFRAGEDRTIVSTFAEIARKEFQQLGMKGSRSSTNSFGV